MKLKEIQRIAALEYNCCCRAECQGECEGCPYNVPEDKEKEFFFEVWELCGKLMQNGMWLFEQERK